MLTSSERCRNRTVSTKTAGSRRKRGLWGRGGGVHVWSDPQPDLDEGATTNWSAVKKTSRNRLSGSSRERKSGGESGRHN